MNIENKKIKIDLQLNENSLKNLSWPLTILKGKELYLRK